MRSIAQPGAAQPERIQWVEARGRAFSFTLAAGLPLLEAAHRGQARVLLHARLGGADRTGEGVDPARLPDPDGHAAGAGGGEEDAAPPRDVTAGESPVAEGTIGAVPGRRRPARYGLMVQFESRPDDQELLRLVAWEELERFVRELLGDKTLPATVKRSDRWYNWDPNPVGTVHTVAFTQEVK